MKKVREKEEVDLTKERKENVVLKMTTPYPVVEKKGLERRGGGGRLRSCLDTHKYTRMLPSEPSKNILYCGSTWEAVKGQNCHEVTRETRRKIKHKK